LRSGLFPKPAHAFLKLLAKRRWGLRIECDEIPEWLRAIAAEPRKRFRIAIRMASDMTVKTDARKTAIEKNKLIQLLQPDISH
jgi:hypothetical protein